MKIGDVIFRPVTASDNSDLAVMIRTILDELEVPQVGSTYEDQSLDLMYESFSVQGAAYYVAEYHNELLGGGGIIHLNDAPENVCELQKMYLTKSTRGKGIGTKLLTICLEKARDLGYKYCYLETMSNMKAAQALYIKNGFRYLDQRMGNTGHYVCPVWMIKNID